MSYIYLQIPMNWKNLRSHISTACKWFTERQPALHNIMKQPNLSSSPLSLSGTPFSISCFPLFILPSPALHQRQQLLSVSLFSLSIKTVPREGSDRLNHIRAFYYFSLLFTFYKGKYFCKRSESLTGEL